MEIPEGYLTRFFKKQTGKSFPSYLLWVRIEKAKEYLRTTDYTNNEIAALTGFSSANTFYRNFQKLTGITPANYKNEISEKSTAEL